MPHSPGDVIAGKYRIERPLGEGGMGRVFVATHGILRKRVALKVMAERFRVDASAVERFFREAVAASKVDHPAIVQVFDAGVHEGAPFMAMELLEGEDLDQRLERDHRIPLEETLRIARPVLSALDAAHRVGVVHRDIKPPNIFLAKRSNGIVTPKLLDFGIAKHLNDPSFDRLTQSGSVLGTPLYLSPEQARGEVEVDHRADIYSISVTLYHCLAGTTPYEANNFAELIGKMFSSPPRALTELAPDVPPEVCSWIQRSLSRDPDRRPQSARELLTGLDEAFAASRKSQSSAAFAKTERPESKTTDIVIAEVVPTTELDEVQDQTTAFERSEPPTPPPENVAPPPTRMAPVVREEAVKTPPKTEKSAPPPRESPAAKPPAAHAANTPASASAWSVAGMESTSEEPAAKDSESGGGAFVAVTFLLVGLAVFGAWVFFAGGKAWLAARFEAQAETAENGAQPEETVAAPESTTAVAAVAGGDVEPPATESEEIEVAAIEMDPEEHATEEQGSSEEGAALEALLEAMLEAEREATADEAAQSEDSALPDGHGRVVLSTGSPAEVFVDGRSRGTTPVDLVLPAGPHAFRLVWNNGRVLRRRVTIRAGRTREAFFGERSAVSLDPSVPSGAGPSDPAPVRAVLGSDPGVRLCARHFGRAPAGRVTFRVDVAGTVRLVSSSGSGSAALRCYETRLGRIRFPRGRPGRYSVDFPL